VGFSMSSGFGVGVGVPEREEGSEQAERIKAEKTTNRAWFFVIA